MSRVRTLLAFVVGGALAVFLALIGEALEFGGFAWLAGLVVVLVLASLVDREGFYGPPKSG
jgi:hypothetical protein